MNNPIEILKMIKNPQEYVMNYMKSNNNPILNNLVQMAQNNDTKGLETFAQNMLGDDYKDIMNLLK